MDASTSKSPTVEDYSPLHIAVIEEDIHMVESLLSNGANVSQESKTGRIPLYYACISDSDSSYPICKLLLEAGSDCNHRGPNGITPFLGTLRCGQLELVKLVLQYRADIKAADETGMTALHCAAVNPDVNVIKFLLEHQKFDIQSTSNKGLSALHYAANVANLKVCDFLLGLGAIVNRQSKNGMTPLIVAVMSDCDERKSQTVQLLLENGANVALDAENISVLQFAIQYAREDTRNVLMQHMAKMRRLNLSISEGDRQTIENSDCYRHYYNMCLQELGQMEEAKFYNNVSAFNILMGPRKVISGYARNDELVGALEKEIDNGKFPIYGASIKERLHVEAERQRLRDTAANVIGKLIKLTDPMHPVSQKIVSYLEDANLKFLEM